MKIFDSIARRFGYVPAKQKRGYDGAVVNRLTEGWITSNLSADAEISRDLKRLRERCRDLERNNDYARGFFRALENNILGAGGIAFQSKVKDFNGKFDDMANRIIEADWAKWGRVDFCSVTEDMTWLDCQKLILRTAARDGNAFVRLRSLPKKDTPYRFRLQLYESDHLDTDYNVELQNGNFVRLGVEVNPDGRTEAYHFLNAHPGDYVNGSSNRPYNKRIRVPRAEMFNVFIRERIGQTVGAPWIVTAIRRLNMLGGYEEAELVAARVCAAKMGFFTKQTPEGWTGEEDSNGNMMMDADPGTFEDLPMGVNFQTFDPQHPTNAFPFFLKAMLRGISAGVGMAYHNLANDLESVNFSSARAGVLEERENWKMVQQWFVDHAVQPIFEPWLFSWLLSGMSPLPAEKFDKFNSPQWRGRRWPWVDPMKDVQANLQAINGKLTSRRAVIAEQGGDVEDVFDDLAADAELAIEKGIDLVPLELQEKVSVIQGEEGEEDDEDEETEPSEKSVA
jgi:lambda family phage portal protein